MINPPGLAPLVDAVDQRRHAGIFAPYHNCAYGFSLYTCFHRNRPNLGDGLPGRASNPVTSLLSSLNQARASNLPCGPYQVTGQPAAYTLFTARH